MKKIFMLLVSVLVLFAASCGSESSDSDSDTDNNVYNGEELSTFTDDVKLCMPFLPSRALSAGTTDLSVWSTWSPNNSGSILGKLFEEDNGLDECPYTRIAVLDDHIEMVNGFSDYWDSDGEHTVGSRTATVDTSVDSVDIPYLTGVFQGDLYTVAVDRLVTVTEGTLTVNMAFKISGTTETIVEQYQIGTTEAGVFYTIQNGNYRGIWHAYVGDSKIQFMWDGNIGDQTFRITECTDSGSGSNWEVLGGGEIASGTSELAFIARNDADGSSSLDEYYITLTLDELEDATTQTITDAGVSAPGGAGVLRYITEDNEDCLDFLGIDEYPDDVSDLAWDN